MLMLSPSEKAKNPRSTWTVSNPTFRALKKKFLTGPLGKGIESRYDKAEPTMPPMITPRMILPIFRLATEPPNRWKISFGLEAGNI
jgi:hypothetical protein